MHGLGNDFVIINQHDLPKNYNLQQLSLNIANRRTGIGCDQFIVYDRKQDYYKMIIYNQDGSNAKLCGNAARCLTKLMYLDYDIKEITLRVYSNGVRIHKKELFCKVLGENEITVNTGVVSFEEDWMPVPEEILLIIERYMIDIKEVICVDIGNPHFVIFGDLSTQDKAIVGKKLQEKELFTKGVNVNFASIKNNKIYLSVWERGTGLTLACGSGACATFAAAVKLGFISSPCEVVFQLGSLQMSKQDDNIMLTGSATLVSRGEFFYG